METLWQDIRFGARVLRKNAGFTLVAVLTLALGIGANSALFSVIDGVLLRPLPYSEPDQLMRISQEDIASRTRPVGVSFTKLQRMQAQSKVFEGIAAYLPLAASLTTNGVPEQIVSARATRNLFEVLNVTPARGRNFLPEEDAEGGADVAILTDAFWHSHFAGNPDIVGKAVPIDARGVTIIGVLPPSFRFPFQEPEPDVWMPRVSDFPSLGATRIHSGAGFLFSIGRLKPGETLESAVAELQAINAGYKLDNPGFADAHTLGLVADPLKETLVGPVRTSLLALLAAVGFVLLIGCGNVASLLLARATTRRREIAVRTALGASRARLVRQLLTESVLLSFTGGALGMFLAYVAARLMRSMPPGIIPRAGDIALNGTVLGFTALLCLLTGVAFGLMPSVLVSRQQLNDSLKLARGSSNQGPRSGRSQALLVMAEVAVAVVLVVGAGILLKSFGRLASVNPGFDSEGVTTFSLKLPERRYPQPAQKAEFQRRLLEEMRSIPGVQSAGAISSLPLSGNTRVVYVCAEDMVCQGLGKDPIISFLQASPEYFTAMRIPLLRGRFFDDRDRAGAKPVAIINERSAKRYFPNQDPVGKHIANSRDMVKMEIVGVVGDVKARGLDVANLEEMYQPEAQNPTAVVAVLVRSRGSDQALLSAARRKVGQLDADLPLANVSSMREVVSTSIAQPRLTTQFTGAFGILALLLTAIGIYGVVTYSVAQRTHEIGLRMALGANRKDVLRLVVGQGMKTVLIGIGFGFVAAMTLTRLIRSLLFNTSATDPIIFIGVAFLLALVAIAACYIPARRAARLEPLIALRYE